MKQTQCKARKLLDIGGSYAITIPKPFIRKNGLRHGDMVGLTYDSILVLVVPQVPKNE